MLKRVISLMVGVCCLLAMTSAFAEMTYTGTTTEYNGDNVTVTSTVTGDAGDVATYLVYGNTVGGDDTLSVTNDGSKYTTSSNIVYLDQYAFSSAGSTTFRYTTAASNAGADIVVSGNSAVTYSGGAETEIPEDAVSITVKDSAGNEWNVLDAIPTAEYGWYKIAYSSNQDIVSSVAVDGSPVTNWVAGIDAIWISATEVELTKNSVITLGTAAGSASASTTSMTYLSATEGDAEVAKASVVVVGDVDGDVDEFGVIVAKDQAAADAYIAALNNNWVSGVNAGTNAQKLPALAKDGAGAFGIRIYDNSNFADQTQMLGIVYYYNAGALEVAENGLIIAIPAAE